MNSAGKINVQDIIDRVQDLFPNLNLEVNDENQRRRFIIDFFCRYLEEFCVDVDSINKVQINQPEISIGSDIIATINLKCGMDAIIPDNSVGLFEIICPSTNALWSRIEHALNFFEFGDKVANKIYDHCSPYIDSKQRIKQYTQLKNDLHTEIADAKIKINHTIKLSEEGNNQCLEIEKLNKDVIDERRDLEHKLQQIIARKEMLTLQKNQKTSALEKMKNNVMQRKNIVLNHSADSKLEDELKEAILEKDRRIARKEKNKQEYDEFSQLEKILTQRLSAASKIYEALTKFKELENQSSKDAGKTVEELEDLKNAVIKQQEDTEKLNKIMNKEITLMENTIKRKKSFNNKPKLVAIKGQFKNLDSIKNKLQALNFKEKLIRENFLREENKLKSMQAEIVKSRKAVLDKNKQIFVLEETIKKIFEE